LRYTTQWTRWDNACARGQVEIESIRFEDVSLAGCRGFLNCVEFGEHKRPVSPLS